MTLSLKIVFVLKIIIIYKKNSHYILPSVKKIPSFYKIINVYIFSRKVSSKNFSNNSIHIEWVLTSKKVTENLTFWLLKQLFLFFIIFFCNSRRRLRSIFSYFFSYFFFFFVTFPLAVNCRVCSLIRRKRLKAMKRTLMRCLNSVQGFLNYYLIFIYLFVNIVKKRGCQKVKGNKIKLFLS